MLVLGLTGGIATGKSSVSLTFRKRGIPVVDADIIARQVVEKGKPAFQAIVEEFSGSTPNLLLPDGSLDRPALGRRVFGDDVARKKLNKITHPAVQRAMMWELLIHWMKGHRLCVLDVPLLFEGGLDRVCGLAVCVTTGEKKQMQRLLARDRHLNREEAEKRIMSQMPMTIKEELADVVINNEGSLEQLEHKVDLLIARYRPSWALASLEWLLPPVGLVMAILVLFRRELARRRKHSGTTKPKL
ncbi:Dephospho-CoA kinase cab5 [Savitreella phatthalungensis]